ncbi:MAG: DUF3135 domain-containing protein [Thiobacillaceae bacterium]|nr:DUF3135 domain-containing protein [Thiobacillaceae bacterium]
MSADPHHATPEGEDFDFDSWAELARRDLQAFEARRRALIERVIERAPEHLQPRLRALQWRIDQTRRRYKHPLKSCAVLQDMMWAAVLGRGGLLEALERLRRSAVSGSGPAATARVFEFRR